MLANRCNCECTSKDRIDEQIGQGLVGVVKGPDRILMTLRYLEMSYKHGE
jgi:hypothetical protein